MDNELEVIQSQMEDTRASLAEKLEALENKVLGGVETTATVVASTVETVQETVAAVKDSLDLRKHVQRAPWLMFGGAVGVGFLGGLILSGGRSSSEPSTSRGGPFGAAGASEPAAGGPDFLSSLVHSLKGWALGTMMQTVRDWAMKSLPQGLAPDVAAWIDDMASKIGARTERSGPLEREPASEKGVVPFRQEEWGRPEKKKANGTSGGEKVSGQRRGFKPR